MRIIVEALGHRIFDLELMVPVRKPESASSAAPDRDPHSTTAADAVIGNDGVSGPFGFAPVIKAGS